MDTIIEKGQKKKLLFVVSNGTIHKEFLKSFCELSLKSRNKFELILHLCKDNEQYMDIFEHFTEHGTADVIIFVNPSLGFTCECIYDIFDRCLDSDNIVGVCSPSSILDFTKINENNYKYSEILSKSYDLNLINKNINVDEQTLMKVRGFKLNDIVGISLKISRKGYKPIDISRGFSNMKNECVMITKHKISNNGVYGCLLEYFQYIQKVREENTNSQA